MWILCILVKPHLPNNFSHPFNMYTLICAVRWVASHVDFSGRAHPRFDLHLHTPARPCPHLLRLLTTCTMPPPLHQLPPPSADHGSPCPPLPPSVTPPHPVPNAVPLSTAFCVPLPAAPLYPWTLKELSFPVQYVLHIFVKGSFMLI
jgi:hypothetical protein